MRVMIRADASASIGIGHVMRCLALAQALRDSKDEVILLSSASLAPRVRDAWSVEGVEIRTLDASAAPEDDAQATRDLVRSTGAAWLVVDGYHFDDRYRSVAAGPAMLAWIDDHGAPAADADLIVNGNLYGHRDLYPGTRARLAVGPRYALLRREFRSYRTGSTAREGILVSLGGADPDGQTGALLAALAAHGIRGRVTVGPHQRDAEDVLRSAARFGWASIQAPEDMAELLGSCGLAVVGAGTTVLEALALGTPTVAVQIAENQRLVVEALARLDLATVADGFNPERVAAECAALLRDDRRRENMAMRARQAVDARGARRVVGEMRGALLVLRPALMEDAPLLLEWRNDQRTRLASIDRGTVSYTEHLRWLAASLDSSSRRLLVAELESHPVAVIRLDLDGSRAVLSITIAPDSRGNDLAVPLLRRALDYADGQRVPRVEAKIRRENEASIRAFIAAGFQLDEGSVRSDVLNVYASLPVA